MPGYPLRIGMTTPEFKAEIIDYYFPGLVANHPTVASDYAAIGAFLTRTDEVLVALRTLENELRKVALEQAATLTPHTSPAPTQTGALYNVKGHTRKLISGALARTEFAANFNLPRAGVLLHNGSVIGIGNGPTLDLTADGRTLDGKADPNRPKASLPGGVPKIIGAIHPTDFMVLLKHGYAFKDVGAESAHGEFTHRLQWYAIIKSKGALHLINEPIDLYKKMWFGYSKGTANLATGRQLYMWMALLDCLKSDAEAGNDQFKTMACSPATFNNPEFMNSTLIKQIYGQTNVFGADDSSNLYVLRKLLGARQKKRMQTDGNELYAQKKIGGPAPTNKTVLASSNPTGATELDKLKNVVAWIDSL